MKIWDSVYIFWALPTFLIGHSPHLLATASCIWSGFQKMNVWYSDASCKGKNTQQRQLDEIFIFVKKNFNIAAVQFKSTFLDLLKTY